MRKEMCVSKSVRLIIGGGGMCVSKSARLIVGGGSMRLKIHWASL